MAAGSRLRTQMTLSLLLTVRVQDEEDGSMEDERSKQRKLLQSTLVGSLYNCPALVPNRERGGLGIRYEYSR